MKKLFIHTAFIVISGLAATITSPAQTPDDGSLSRQVDVSRDYIPDVERAGKLNVAPNLVDTVALRPESEYTIEPSAWVTGFGVAAINPARIDPTSYNPVWPFYMKVGGGYPGQSVLDIYYTSKNTGPGSWGVYANHYGHYTDIKNDMDTKARALAVSNTAGIFGKLQVRRMALSGEVGIDHEIWSKYGQFPIYEAYGSGGGSPPYIPAMVKSPLQSYTTPRGRIAFGHDFSDMSYFNFRLGADVYHLTDRLYKSETGLDIFGEIGKMFSGHRITLRADFALRNGGKDLSDFSNSMLTVGPGYEILANRFRMMLGARLGYDMPDGRDNKVWFLPEGYINYDLAGGAFTPFVELDSRLAVNGYREVTRLNPYISPGITMPPSTVSYNLRGGFKGSVASAFSYKLYAGAEIIKNALFSMNIYEREKNYEFLILSEDRVSAFTAGVEMEGRISGSFLLTADFRYWSYSAKEMSEVYDRPQFTSGIALRYNYRDKFFARAGVDLIGKRYFYERRELAPMGHTGYEFFTCEKSLVADVHLGADYYITKNIGVFVEGRNLANSRLYRWNHYAGAGVSVSAGVKIKF